MFQQILFTQLKWTRTLILSMAVFTFAVPMLAWNIGSDGYGSATLAPIGADELDLGADRVLPPTLPHGLGPDVTQDERFTGASLARTDGETLHATRPLPASIQPVSRWNSPRPKRPGPTLTHVPAIPATTASTAPAIHAGRSGCRLTPRAPPGQPRRGRPWR